MNCFQCSKGKLRSRETVIEATVRGETFAVPCEAMVCGRCGFQVLAPEQVDGYTAASADGYRLRHGLLTSAEIRGFREKLRMSQVGFAEYLRVGAASVKRWELGHVQDDAMDELIRLKCDVVHCLSTLRKLQRGGTEAPGRL